MFEAGTITRLRREMAGYAAAFDRALVSTTDAEAVMGDAAAIKHMAATIESLAALRVAETEVWRRHGDRSPQEFLARKTGTSLGKAKEALETAERLADLPATAAAARSGELSPEQASVIADAAGADPGAEARLLGTARRSSLKELRDEAARTKAAHDDLEARRRRIHERRSLRDWTDADGVGHLRLDDNPERIAEIMGVVNPLADKRFEKARGEGRRESPEAYAADALHEAVCGSGETKVSSRHKIICRIDLDALLRGHPIEGEVADIAGVPVAVSAITDLMATGNPFLAAVVTKGVKITGVAHLGRPPNVFQRTGLEWLAPTCVAEGCSRANHLQVDHRVDWAKSRVTVFDLLDPLCSHHHRLKTFDNWALVEGSGKRAMVPPEDPRHPRAHAPPGAA